MVLNDGITRAYDTRVVPFLSFFADQGHQSEKDISERLIHVPRLTTSLSFSCLCRTPSFTIGIRAVTDGIPAPDCVTIPVLSPAVAPNLADALRLAQRTFRLGELGIVSGSMAALGVWPPPIEFSVYFRT